MILMKQLRCLSQRSMVDIYETDVKVTKSQLKLLISQLFCNYTETKVNIELCNNKKRF